MYYKYNGHIDRWARTGSKNDKLVITDSDWYTIDSYLQDIILVKRGLASLEFENALDNNLENNCENQETINQLMKLAENIEVEKK